MKKNAKYLLSLYCLDITIILLILFIHLIASPASLTCTSKNSEITNKLVAPQNQTNSTAVIDPYLGYIQTKRGFFPNGGEGIELYNQKHALFFGTQETELYKQSEIFYGKMNLSGQILFKNSWKKNALTKGGCLAIDEEHDRFFICGQTSNNITNLFSMVIVCLDGDTGIELWNRTYNRSLNLRPSCAFLVEDSLLVFGAQYNYDHWGADSDVFLGCYDRFNGTECWFKIFDSDYYDEPVKLFHITNITQNSLFLCFNRYISTDNPGKFNTEFFLQKLLMNGSQLWMKKVQFEEDIIIHDGVFSPENNNLYLGGEGQEDNEIDTDGILSVISLEGKLINQSVFGSKNNEESIFSVVLTSQEEIIAGGHAPSSSRNLNVAFLATFDLQCQLLSYKRTERYLQSLINDLTITSEDEIFLTGFCQMDYDFHIYSRILTGISYDSDRDDLTDPFELYQGTDPYNPDSDDDGWSDGEEYMWNTNPLNRRSNPDIRNFWKNFGYILFILLFFGFFLINFIISVLLSSQARIKIDRKKPTKNERKEFSPIVALFLKMKNKFSKKGEANVIEEK
ncbi:MAG: hypothetical protein GF308_03730 [Candidatus Heimdallarchaeota archaeon]|nr:hypothetical protein [Candidatus Heimdallarchaeota archaeon]